MIKTSPAKSDAPLNKAQARTLTERIRKHIDAAWADITAAYEGKAWKALGYASWEAYVKAEFDMSRRRSYQLIDQGRVIREIAEATGQNVQHAAQISYRDAEKIKGDLPSVTAEIRERVEAGETPETAVARTVAEARAEKERQREERKAKQADLDRQRDAARAALPASVQKAEAAKQAAIEGRATVKVGLSDAERIAELEEAVRLLEVENAALKSENQMFAEMKAEWEKGGFEEVIRGKDEVIRAQASRIESESQEKVRNLRSMEWWKKEAFKLGYSNNTVIDIETGEVVDG